MNTHANKINSHPVDSPVLLNRSEHHMNSSNVNQSPSTSLQLSSPTPQPSSQSINNTNSSSTHNSNTTPKNTTKELAVAGTNKEQISANPSLISDPSKCSILNSKAHTSMPYFSNHIRGSDSKNNQNSNDPRKPLANHNNDENNFGKYFLLLYQF